MHRILDQYRRQILLRVVAGAAGLFLLAWGVIPLYSSRFHIGCLVLMLAGLLLLGAALLYPALARGIRRLWKRRAGRITLSGIGAAACLLTLLFLTVSGVMTAAACAPPPEGATVVVLGAALRGEQPSRMLAERLKTAATYLRDHPESSCVVSGGQNDDEIISFHKYGGKPADEPRRRRAGGASGRGGRGDAGIPSAAGQDPCGRSGFRGNRGVGGTDALVSVRRILDPGFCGGLPLFGTRILIL